MHLHHARALTSIMTSGPSRRDVLAGLAAAGCGLAIARLPRTAEANKKHRHKGKKAKLQRNEFGCVDVGGNCLGNSANCCSGICDGTKPKKGKKDRSVCEAHDTAGICFADSNTCTVGQPVHCHPENTLCACFLTTGKAGFCGDSGSSDPAETCRDCVRDTDCQKELGPGAACVVLTGICSSICPATGRRGCIRPCPAETP